MESIQPKSKILLCNTDYLKVIKVAGESGNLSLTTFVAVNTDNNEVEVYYAVSPFNYTAHRRLHKTFTNYSEAFDYYQKVYNKFRKY